MRSATCPVARALSIVGDRWSLLIIRDALDGSRRFKEFQQDLGIAKNILTERLKMLVDEGVLELQPASDGSMYQEYQLTPKGEELFPIIVAFRQWGEAHLFRKSERHSQLLAREGGKPLQKLEVRALDGSTVTARNAYVKKVAVPAAKETSPRRRAKA
jgi:DNA-binding HxlR family transcriptional regulator